MQGGHIQKMAQWAKKYGDVIRVSLGEREAVWSPPCFGLPEGKAMEVTGCCTGFHQ